MKKDDFLTKVIFKKAKYDDGSFEIIALFPEGSANLGNVVGYTKIGEHTEISLDFIRERCKTCLEPEYRELKELLETNYGYNFKVCKKITSQDEKKSYGWFLNNRTKEL